MARRGEHRRKRGIRPVAGRGGGARLGERGADIAPDPHALPPVGGGVGCARPRPLVGRDQPREGRRLQRRHAAHEHRLLLSPPGGDRAEDPPGRTRARRRVDLDPRPDRPAGAAARDLLAAANAALAADGLAGRYQIGIVSAYRPAQHQFEIWEGFGRRGGFPAYYRRAVNEGILRPGDYGADAVQKMAPYIGQYIASPVFSNHQDGLAIDFGTCRAGSPDLSVIVSDT